MKPILLDERLNELEDEGRKIDRKLTEIHNDLKEWCRGKNRDKKRAMVRKTLFKMGCKKGNVFSK